MSMPGIGAPTGFYKPATEVLVLGNTNSTTGTTSMNTPDGLLQDDYVIVFGSSDADALSTPTGYTVIFSVAAPYIYAWYKKMGATPDTTITNLTTSSSVKYYCCAVRYANTSSPIGQSNDYATASTFSTIQTNPVTPDNVGDVIFVHGMLDDDIVTFNSLGGGYTDVFIDNHGSSGSGGSTGIYYKIADSTNAENPPDIVTNGSDVPSSGVFVIKYGG